MIFSSIQTSINKNTKVSSFETWVWPAFPSATRNLLPLPCSPTRRRRSSPNPYPSPPLCLAVLPSGTNSCFGIWQHDRVEIIANHQGNRTTPSYAAFTDSERLIGDGAKNQVAMNPINAGSIENRLRWADPDPLSGSPATFVVLNSWWSLLYCLLGCWVRLDLAILAPVLAQPVLFFAVRQCKVLDFSRDPCDVVYHFEYLRRICCWLLVISLRATGSTHLLSSVDCCWDGWLQVDSCFSYVST